MYLQLTKTKSIIKPYLLYKIRLPNKGHRLEIVGIDGYSHLWESTNSIFMKRLIKKR